MGDVREMQEWEVADESILEAVEEGEEAIAKVRLNYCSSGDDLGKAIALQNLLLRFYRELSKRACGKEIPGLPSIHREHGWYLSYDG